MLSSMFSAFIFLALSGLCPLGLVAGVPYDYGFDAYHGFQKRQAAQRPIVTGIPVGYGPIPLRREFREVEADKDTWNLYILALSWMQFTDQTNPFSYYQIAGIHGAPGSTWGGVSAVPAGAGSGYCQHVSIIFPPWHRPYLALYEQILHDIVRHIVSLYAPDEKERLRGVADAFRIPYLDWAAAPPEGASVLPLSVATPSINVSGPNGIQPIDNPLFSYVFKPLNGSIFPGDPWSQWNETKRSPQPELAPDAVSNNSIAARSLDVHLQTHQQRLYNLFANYDDYFNFSNEGWIPSDKLSTYDSIESLHDSFHLLAGGTLGHLAIIPFSAFDPLFFLHHAMVDRIFSMWQLIYNESYVPPAQAIYSSHTTTAGDIQDTNTPLTPFFFDETTFWTSEMARDHKVFGYSYADVVNGSREEVISTINNMYTDYSPATMMSRQRQRLHTVQLAGVVENGAQLNQPIHSGLTGTRGDSPRPWYMPRKFILEEGMYREWITNIRAKKHAMKMSFSIYLFFGSLPDDSSSWAAAPNLVGTLGVFSHNGRHGRMVDRHIAGTIPLTSALLDMVEADHLRSLGPEHVEPFLMAHLNVGVALLNGTVVSPLEVAGLGISIVSSQVRASAENRLAEWGEVESHFDLLI